MKPVNFAYVRPTDLAAALELVADDTRSVKVVAGSQSLGPLLNLRLVQPDLLVDITGIDVLRQVEEHPGEIRIGACITHADIEDGRVRDVTRGALPAVARGIAYRAVRNRGTIGGSLTHADPSADWISILAALGADVLIAGRAGQRRVSVESFMRGPLEADLEPGELLVGVCVPKLGSSARWGYFKTCRKTGEFADAIGACMIDPERGIFRAVMGATQMRPTVVADARAMLGGGIPAQFDTASAAGLAEAAGMTDPLDRQIHVVALRRAAGQATRA